jgi:hypothetical protein
MVSHTWHNSDTWWDENGVDYAFNTCSVRKMTKKILSLNGCTPNPKIRGVTMNFDTQVSYFLSLFIIIMAF